MELQNGGMEMINGGNLYRSDRVSDEYLLVNNCGYQATGSVDTTSNIFLTTRDFTRT